MLTDGGQPIVEEVQEVIKNTVATPEAVTTAVAEKMTWDVWFMSNWSLILAVLLVIIAGLFLIRYRQKSKK